MPHRGMICVSSYSSAAPICRVAQVPGLVTVPDGQTSLYDRLGGIFPIAAVVNGFSDAVLANPAVGRDSPNPQLREWSRNQSGTRLAGLKFLRTLWVAAGAGGPYVYEGTKPGKCPFSLAAAHKDLLISGPEFDAVAGELQATMTKFGVPLKEQSEVLQLFAAHKGEVTQETGPVC